MEERDSAIASKLKELYYDPGDEGSYGGVERLFQRAKDAGIAGVKRADVVNFLQNQRSYTLHKPSRRNFKRNRTVVKGIDEQWQADLADMQGLTRQNSGYRYILTVIDVFSKFAWAIPVKEKSGTEMLRAFKKLFFDAAPRKPKRIQTDKGKEFLNKDVKGYLGDMGIELFQTFSDKKAAVVDRFNRTLKTRIWTYFSAQNTKRYIDVLPKIMKSYNNTPHRSIGMPPSQVKEKDKNRIWVRLYGDGSQLVPKIKMTPGQKVRVSRVKGIFDKGYLPNWTEQHYRLEGTSARDRRTYKLQNIRGEPIDGSYYEEELQPIRDNEHKIEKILRRRVNADGSKEALVKWKGWSDKFNTWISTDDDGKPLPNQSPK